MAKSQDLFFNNFQKGIGTSPYVGFGHMQNLEIFQIPGVVKMKYRQVLKYATLGLPIAIVHDYLGNEWCYTNNNYLYKNGVANFQTGTYNGVGNGFDMKVIGGTFIILTRGDGSNGYVDLINIQTGSNFFYPDYTQTNLGQGRLTPLYNLAIQVLTGNQQIYIANGNYVANITGFTPNANPAIAPTATFTPQAIPLQVGDFARTLGVLGRNLLVGTQGGSSFADLTFTQANIYPYDLGSLALGFQIPIEENGINQIFCYNNQAFIHAGLYGNIYVTNGSSIQFYQRVTTVNRSFGTTMLPRPNAINYVNNRLLVGTGNVGASDTFLSTSYHGIYEIQGSTKALNFQTISTLNVGQTQNLAVGAILPIGNDSLVVGWQDGSTFGVDTTDGNTYSSFSAFMECPVEIIGEPEDNANANDIIVYLTRPLVSGQQIRLQYRDGDTNPWIPILNYRNGSAYLDMSAGPANETALFTKSLIVNTNSLQIQAAFNQTTFNQGSNVFVLGIKVKRNVNE